MRFTKIKGFHDGHRYFKENKPGVPAGMERIAVADQSGDTPEQTDDGVLFIDFERATFDEAMRRRMIPVMTEKGDRSFTTPSYQEEIDYVWELQRKRFQLVPPVSGFNFNDPAADAHRRGVWMAVAPKHLGEVVVHITISTTAYGARAELVRHHNLHWRKLSEEGFSIHEFVRADQSNQPAAVADPMMADTSFKPLPGGRCE